jgi:hypothetical protein
MSMSLEKAQRVAELAQERVGLLERLADVNREIAAAMADEPGAVSDTTVVRSTAPAPKKAKKTGITVIGKGVPRKTDDGKQPDLPTLLAQIAAEQQRPLKIADFVSLARAAGYQTDAKDFPNMVYQALLKLVKRGILEKDQESRDYHYVGQAA